MPNRRRNIFPGKISCIIYGKKITYDVIFESVISLNGIIS